MTNQIKKMTLLLLCLAITCLASAKPTSNFYVAEDSVAISDSAFILSINPDTISVIDSMDIVVSAANIDFSQGTNTIWLEHETVAENYYISEFTADSSSISFSRPFNFSSTSGFYNLFIDNSEYGQSISKTNALFLEYTDTIPLLTGISINNASKGDTILVSISGRNTHFNGDSLINTVYLKDGSQTIYSTQNYIVNSIELQAEFMFSAADSAGSYSLYVINQQDDTLMLDNAFELSEKYIPPTIIDVDPGTINLGDSLSISVTAENIDFSQGTNSIWLEHGKGLQNYYINVYTADSSMLQFNNPFNYSSPTGYYNLFINNSNHQQTMSYSNGILLQDTANIPRLISISENSASQGDTAYVTIHGSNTHFSLDSDLNTIYLKSGNQIIYASENFPLDSVQLGTQFVFSLADSVGIYSLYVINQQDDTLLLDNVFELSEKYFYPAIIDINPQTIYVGDSLEITVTAENIDFSQGTNAIQLEHVNGIQNYDIYDYIADSTTIRFDNPFGTNSPTGYYNLNINNSDYGQELIENFAIQLKEPQIYPEILSLSVTTANQGDNIWTSILGKNTHFSAPLINNNVYLTNGIQSIEAIEVYALDSTNLEANFAFELTDSVGAYSLFVVNEEDDTIILTNAFELNEAVLSPSIKNVDPGTIIIGDSLEISVTAENINFSQGTNAIRLEHGNGLQNYYIYDYIADTSIIRFDNPFNNSSPYGYYNLFINNSNFSEVISLNNAVLLKDTTITPSIIGLSVDSASVGENVSLQIYGKDTHFNGYQITNTVYLSNGVQNIFSSINMPLDSVTMDAEFNFEDTDSIGAYSLYVINQQDDTIVLDNAFKLTETYALPYLSDVSPDTINMGDSLEITVTAKNIDFSQGTNSIQLEHVNGTQNYDIYDYIADSSNIRFENPFNTSSPIGYYNLYINNSNYGQALSKYNAVVLQDTNAVPELISMLGNSASLGDNIWINIIGNNTHFSSPYVNNTVYLSNDSQTIYASTINPVDSMQIEANFNFELTDSIGIYSLYVINDEDDTLTLINAFELIGTNITPSIVDVTPDTIIIGDTLEISITAENIDFSQGTNSIQLEHVNGTQNYYIYDYVADSSVIRFGNPFSFSSPTGYYNLNVNNSNLAQKLSKNNGVLLQAPVAKPELLSISQDSATQDDNIWLTILGEYTHFSSPFVNNIVYLSNDSQTIYASTINPVDSMQIEVNFEFELTDSIGIYSLYVINEEDDTLIHDNAFELIEAFTAPEIINVQPGEINAGESYEISVTAKNIDFTNGSNIVTFTNSYDGISLDTLVINGSTKDSLSFTYHFDNAISDSYYDLYILNTNNSDELFYLNAIYVYPKLPGSIKSISPSNGLQGRLVNVEILGENTNFSMDAANNTVTLVNQDTIINAQNILAINDTTIEAQFYLYYDMTPGLYSINVVNDYDHQMILTDAFEIVEDVESKKISVVEQDNVSMSGSVLIDVEVENVDLRLGENIVSLRLGNTVIYAIDVVVHDSGSLTAEFIFESLKSVTQENDLPEGDYNLCIQNETFDESNTSNQTLVIPNAVKLQNTGVSTQIDIVNEQQFYPNPVNSIIYFTKMADLVLMKNINGVELMRTKNVNQINISEYKPGVYILMYKIEDTIYTGKVIKK